MLRVPFFLYTGLKNFTRGGYEHAAKSFDQGVMDTSLKGKTCMVTGANQGLGFQISLELAKRGASLYMVCRNKERGLASISKVKEESSNEDVHLLLCDISSLQDVKRMSEEYKATGKPLDVLVNNAGVMVHEPIKSVDNYEINFATNTLGTYAVTRALEPCLKQAAPGSRVIMVSSGGALTSHLEVDDLQGDKMKKNDGTEKYARDKRRQIAMAEYLAAEWKDQGVVCCSMHPGWAETEGVKTSIPGFYKTFKDKMRSVEQGADTAVWLSLCPFEMIEGGGFYLDRKPQAKHLPLAGTKYSTEKVRILVDKLDAMMMNE
jgi:dehydrogenase/reductase SDR family protein 12